MKKLGIIGGLGPESTAAFYLELNQLMVRVAPHRPACMIWNTPIDLRTEAAMLAGREDTRDYLPLLIQGAHDLELAGCDYLAIPCNTMHIYAEELRQGTSLQLISIIDETAEALHRQKETNALIMATSQTIQSGLYQDALHKRGIQAHTPQPHQSQIDKLIAEVLESGASNDSAEVFAAILAHYETKAVILACTELSLLRPKGGSRTFYDSNTILAEACTKRLMEEAHEN